MNRMSAKATFPGQESTDCREGFAKRLVHSL
jgi:hypothetical protein